MMTRRQFKRIVGMGLVLGACGAGGAIAALLASGYYALPRTQKASPISQNDDALWAAICTVESGNNPLAVNAKTQAVGIAQIRPIAVRDANRILGMQHYALNDRLSPTKSREIFNIIIGHYENGASNESKARRWVGGGRYKNTDYANAYWAKVKAQIK